MVFPITLLLLWRVRRSWVLPGLVAGTVASLAASAVLTPRSPGVAFYLLPARIWELLAGGLLAWRVAQPPDSPASRVRELAAALGLGMILSAMALFDSDTPFPGVHAVLPVVGSMLLIQFAPGSAIGRLLSARPVVFIGLISYSAYLWHQPLFALARYVSVSGEMGTSTAIALGVATLLLATITWRFVETPFRDRRRVSWRVLASNVVIGLVAVGVPAAVLAFGGDAGRRSPVSAGVVGQSLLALFSDCNTSLSPTRRLGLGCLLDPSSAAPPSFLVVGDSHSDALFPAFAKVSRDTGRQGRLLQHFSCSPLLEITERPFGTPGCLLMHEQALAAVEQGRIGSVFLVSRFAYDYMPRDLFPRRLEKTIAAYAERGAIVYIVLQAPEQPRFDRYAYRRALLRQRFLRVDPTAEIERMSSSRAEHEATQAFVNGVFAAYRDDGRVRLVDFTPVLCTATTCAVGTAAAPYYVDDHHLTDTGAVLISSVIADALAGR